MAVPNTALVTGASGGIGLAITHALLARGTQVWGTARDIARLPVAEGFHPLVLDLSGPGAAGRLLLEAEAASGGIDLLVCNAGYGIFGPVEAVEWPEWRRQMEDLLLGTLELAQPWLAGALQRRKGTLVMVSSLAAEFPIPGMAAYSAAKAGVSAWMTAAADECRGSGVGFIDLRPGDIRTGFNLAVARPRVAGLEGGREVRFRKLWERLDGHFSTAPGPEVVARDLLRWLEAGRTGVLRSGRFFEARMAPLAARLLPIRVQRLLARWYLGCG